MLYYLPWILLIALTVLLSFAAFFWGMKSGQFSDQARARYLPLVDGLPPPGPEESPKMGAAVYAMIFILGTGLAGMLAAVYLILTR